MIHLYDTPNEGDLSMEHDLLKAKYQDETFEAIVDYEEEEIVIRYHNDQPNAFRMNLSDLGSFSDFVDKLWERQKEG